MSSCIRATSTAPAAVAAAIRTTRRNYIQVETYSWSQRTFFSSSSYSPLKTDEPVVVIPPPTWSVSDLKLTSSTTPSSSTSSGSNIVSKKELYTLARRCQIDVRLLPAEELQKLQGDLAGIMRCTSLVCDLKFDNGDDSDVDAEEMYDRNKVGVHRGNKDEIWNEEEQNEAKKVLQSVQSKMRLINDKDNCEEKYFSVITGSSEAR